MTPPTARRVFHCRARDSSAEPYFVYKETDLTDLLYQVLTLPT
jgi:hypothetical protein